MLLQEIKPKQEVSLYSLQRRERNTRLMFEPHLFSSAEKPCRGLPWGIYLLYFSATGFGEKKDFQIPFWSLHEAGKDSDSRDIWPGAGNAILLLSTTDCKRSCKQPHSSSWRASQGLGNHKIKERKYTQKKSHSLQQPLEGFHWLCTEENSQTFPARSGKNHTSSSSCGLPRGRSEFSTSGT